MNGSSDLEIKSIWFTNHTNPSYSQSTVTAISQLPFLEEGSSTRRNFGGFLFAVSGDQLIFSRLDCDVQWPHHEVLSILQDNSGAVPRKLFVGPKPTKILYMEPLRKMVVSTIEAKEESTPPDRFRVLHSSLKLLNVDDDRPLDESDVKVEDESVLSNRLLVAQYDLKHAERVYSIIKWPFLDHQGNKYSLLIVGTGIQVGLGEEIGRRLIFNTGKTGNKLRLQKESTYDHPVYCIAMWSNELIISVMGTTLSLDYFDSQAGRYVSNISSCSLSLLIICRWFKRGTKDLPSPGLHISARPPFVYVSTLQHSHICYKIVKTALEGKFDFEQVFTDCRERSCTHHLVLDLPSVNQDEGITDRIVVFTDKKSASLIALYHPPERTYKNAADTIFEACLPRTVIRLQSGNIRPPWCRPVHSNSVAGVLTDDIIGACSDGTIYTFSILSQPALHLLRLLQNLIQAKAARNPSSQDTLIKPRSNDVFDILMSGTESNEGKKITARSVDPKFQAHGLSGPRNKHVDGDLLVNWMNESGELERLVCEGTEKNVKLLFATLAQELDKAWPSSTETEMEDLLVCVRQWVSEVLMPVL